jgi:hypothetical protein
MFEHVTVLLSFVFAIALTHVLTSTTELIWARNRLRFSWLQTLWMVSAVLSILVNWIGLAPLASMKNWSPAEITLQFGAAVVQYYTCSLISIRPKDEGLVEMPAFYERERPSIFTAYSAMMVISIFQNVWDAKNYGMSTVVMLQSIVLVAIMLAATLIAGWARPRWSQWMAATAMLAIQSYFLLAYALPA